MAGTIWCGSVFARPGQVVPSNGRTLPQQGPPSVLNSGSGSSQQALWSEVDVIIDVIALVYSGFKEHVDEKNCCGDVVVMFQQNPRFSNGWSRCGWNNLFWFCLFGFLDSAFFARGRQVVPSNGDTLPQLVEQQLSAKWGRCPQHGVALFPHIYASGKKQGRAFLLLGYSVPFRSFSIIFGHQERKFRSKHPTVCLSSFRMIIFLTVLDDVYILVVVSIALSSGFAVFGEKDLRVANGFGWYDQPCSQEQLQQLPPSVLRGRWTGCSVPSAIHNSKVELQ